MKPDQEEEKEEAAEVETQEEGKTQDVSEEQPESEVQIKEEKQPASESAAVPELNEEAQQPAVQSQETQIAVQTQTVEAPHPGWNQSGGQTYYLDENMKIFVTDQQSDNYLQFIRYSEIVLIEAETN